MLVPCIRMDLKRELQALMASGLVFQPGPVFGRTNRKTLGYAKFLLLWVMCWEFTFFRAYFYGWVFGCLPASFHLHWWRRGSNNLFFLYIPCLDFLVFSWTELLHPSLKSPVTVLLSSSAVAHTFHLTGKFQEDFAAACKPLNGSSENSGNTIHLSLNLQK